MLRTSQVSIVFVKTFFQLVQLKKENAVVVMKIVNQMNALVKAFLLDQMYPVAYVVAVL